jgi:transcriptional regulator with XRE-family HTH domain
MQLAVSETAEDIRRRVGAVLRRHRELQGRRLTDVATEAGCSAAYLSEVERGRKDVSTELLVAIAYALSVPVGRVYAEVADSFDSPGQDDWPADPRQQLRVTSQVLDASSLATVARFSAFLASGAGQSQRRPIGFMPPRPVATT